MSCEICGKLQINSADPNNASPKPQCAHCTLLADSNNPDLSNLASQIGRVLSALTYQVDRVLSDFAHEVDSVLSNTVPNVPSRLLNVPNIACIACLPNNQSNASSTVTELPSPSLPNNPQLPQLIHNSSISTPSLQETSETSETDKTQLNEATATLVSLNAECTFPTDVKAPDKYPNEIDSALPDSRKRPNSDAGSATNPQKKEKISKNHPSLLPSKDSKSDDTVETRLNRVLTLEAVVKYQESWNAEIQKNFSECDQVTRLVYILHELITEEKNSKRSYEAEVILTIFQKLEEQQINIKDDCYPRLQKNPLGITAYQCKNPIQKAQQVYKKTQPRHQFNSTNPNTTSVYSAPIPTMPLPCNSPLNTPQRLNAPEITEVAAAQPRLPMPTASPSYSSSSSPSSSYLNARNSIITIEHQAPIQASGNVVLVGRRRKFNNDHSSATNSQKKAKRCPTDVEDCASNPVFRTYLTNHWDIESRAYNAQQLLLSIGRPTGTSRPMDYFRHCDIINQNNPFEKFKPLKELLDSSYYDEEENIRIFHILDNVQRKVQRQKNYHITRTQTESKQSLYHDFYETKEGEDWINELLKKLISTKDQFTMPGCMPAKTFEDNLKIVFTLEAVSQHQNSLDQDTKKKLKECNKVEKLAYTLYEFLKAPNESNNSSNLLIIFQKFKELKIDIEKDFSPRLREDSLSLFGIEISRCRELLKTAKKTYRDPFPMTLDASSSLPPLFTEPPPMD